MTVVKKLLFSTGIASTKFPVAMLQVVNGIVNPDCHTAWKQSLLHSVVTSLPPTLETQLACPFSVLSQCLAAVGDRMQVG